jgi:hypothetical protein
VELIPRVVGVLAGTPHPHPSPHSTGKPRPHVGPTLDPHQVAHHVSAGWGIGLLVVVALIALASFVVAYGREIIDFFTDLLRYAMMGACALGVGTAFYLVAHFGAHWL